MCRHSTARDIIDILHKNIYVCSAGKKQRERNRSAIEMGPTAALVLSLCVCFLNVAVFATNTRPIIGVVSEKQSHSEGSYIAASYVKFIEAAGGRVAPILSSSSDDELTAMFKSINGVLFPGGGVSLNSSGYAHVGSFMLNLAKQANDNDDYFPVWGTCLGFELLSYLQADMGISVLSRVDASNLPLPLNLTSDAATSHMFSLFTPKLLSQLSTESVTYNNHVYGVTTATFYNSNLKPFYKVLSTNKDRQGVEFVSSMEAYSYPFYGIQWHAEKNGFEWTTHEAIPHSETAVAVMQGLANFLVNEARKSDHKFASSSDEEKALIYQHVPTYIGNHSNFTQIYVFSE